MAATQDEGGDEAGVCALCCQQHPTTFVVTVRATIVLNVLTPTLVETKVCMRHIVCNVHNGWPACFSVRWGALSKTIAQRVIYGGENFPAFLRVRLVCFPGVIFTPSEPPTSGTISSTKGRPCRSPTCN